MTCQPVETMEDLIGNQVGSLGEIFGLDLGQTNVAIAFISLTFLGTAFHHSNERYRILAPFGWIGIGVYFFIGAHHYIEISDPLLILMSVAALPVCTAYAGWEAMLWKRGESIDSVDWLRGAVFWSAMPYLAIQHIPMLNAAVVWFTAWNTSLFLQWTGAGDIHLGQMMVDLGTSSVTWDDWDGSRWLLTTTLGDGGFYVPMVNSDGTEINIGFILGCSALQSMIVFVGAIVAVQSAPWIRRLRALAITIPLIHILNVFRNAGIIWMHIEYQGNWDLLGVNIFDFSHAYAAKAISLTAMFFIAIALFDLLPKLHQNVLSVLKPVVKIVEKDTRRNLS